MSLDSITIESNYPEVNTLVDLTALANCHSHLKISKPIMYYFISDNDLLEVNRQSLDHDYYTDIITFDYSDDDDIEAHEILISWDRIQDNAKNLNQAVKTELHRVCFHGMLHLHGVDDKTKKQQKNMTNKEDELLALYCST